MTDGVADAARAASAWALLRYRHPFRKYQALALAALPSLDGRRFHVVAPPGSGKTVLGLEVARRLAVPTLVLCPNTAIQMQWRRQLDDFVPPGAQLPAGFASTSAGRLAPLTVLTYQSLCNLADPDDLLDAAALELWRSERREAQRLSDAELADEEDRLRRDHPRTFARELAAHAGRLKRDLARGDGRVRLLDLLHPNSRQLVEGLRRGGYRAVILDECHHLFSLWGYVVRELVEALGAGTLVVGLTSTPPVDLSGEELDLYRELLGEPSFQVPTPAVVREGHLAPYQDLAYFVSPLPVELEFVTAQHRLFQELITRVLGADFASLSLTEWVIRRVRTRESGPAATTGEGGARVTFGRLARRHPALARAAIRFLHAGRHPLPPEVRLNEQLRLPPDIDDWIVLLEDYCLRCLRPSADGADAAALREVRQALVGLGYVLTRNGIRSYVSPVDRVLALSAAKEVAAADILRHEHDALGPALRALVICDYERAGTPLRAELAAVLDRQAGSALRVLAHLAADPFTRPLHPMLVTGSGVYCVERTADHFAQWLAARGEAGEVRWEREAAVDVRPGGEPVGRVVGEGEWRTGQYLPLVTAFFEEGRSQCLAGTRSLLGEGWDAPRTNTLIDLTTAATHTSVHQLRGRTLRLDPAWPDKVANNWDVVCVADLPKGGGDYRRFVRKHRHYYGLTADGTVESGVAHVHPGLSPFAPPRVEELAALNRALLGQSARRAAIRQAWRVGTPYENRDLPSVRVRWARPLGVGPRQSRGESAAPERLGVVAARGLLAVAVATALAPSVGLAVPLALALAALLVAVGAIRLAAKLGEAFGQIPSELALEGCARAVLASLQEAKLAPADLSFEDIAVEPGADGYYRCHLSRGPAETSRLFAECLEDVLAPVENQRYLIPRHWALPPTTAPGRVLFVARSLVGGAGLYATQYHPVPDLFAVNRQRALVFARHWNRFVSPGEPVYAYAERAQRLVVAERGKDSFGILCQLRSIWR